MANHGQQIKDTTMTTETKKRTITLTDRPPVKIVDSDWPEIACGDYRPGAFVNGTPKNDTETDRYTIRVRQRGDKTLVYGVVDAATPWAGTESWRGGELIDTSASGDIVAAIKRVGASGQMPDRVIRECIADLPVEDI